MTLKQRLISFLFLWLVPAAFGVLVGNKDYWYLPVILFFLMALLVQLILLLVESINRGYEGLIK